jgi:hypothetical protein
MHFSTAGNWFIRPLRTAHCVGRALLLQVWVALEHLLQDKDHLFSVRHQARALTALTR